MDMPYFKVNSDLTNNFFEMEQMKGHLFNRRRFIKDGSKAVAGITLLSSITDNTWAFARKPPRIRFSVISINHSHIYGMIESVIKGGGELVSVYAKEPELMAEFSKKY